MAPDVAEQLARADRAYIVAAAGCGKTEAVARAAGLHAEGRQLVLTHTHAGVKALKDRLRKIGAERGRVRVDTIAGFALRYAASFPRTSGLATTEPRTKDDWDGVYTAALRVFAHGLGGAIAAESYAGVFVDEYQDCVVAQHELVMALASVLPCRIVLDPLQGIFAFGGQVLVSVDTIAAAEFEPLIGLTTPWRWRESNPELGEWLVAARVDLENGRDLDLVGAPIRRGQSTPAGKVTACFDAVGEGGSVVAVGQWPPDCHSLATKLRGVFTCMEPVECPDLMAWTEKIEAATGPERAAAVVDFAAACMTRVGTVLRPAADALRSGSTPNVRGSPEAKAAIEALTAVAGEPALAPIPDAMAAIEQIHGRKLYRRELWREMARTIRVFAAERHPTLPGAAWHVRDRGRHAGRRVEHRTVSRTLLVKGLEFDHAIVLNADAHNRSNLYVALTRGSRSVTVLSSGSTVSPG